jgi:hypothetical protein
MNFSDESLTGAATTEKYFKEFFLNVKTLARSKRMFCCPFVRSRVHLDFVSLLLGEGSNDAQMWNDADRALHDRLLAAQADVHKALLNNLDFSNAMTVLSSKIFSFYLFFLLLDAFAL